jgi:hypothetical protein
MDDQRWVADLMSISDALSLDPDQVLNQLVADWRADLLTTGTMTIREALLAPR